MVKRKPKKEVLTSSALRRVCRATCSSTMKGHGRPAHGCAYTYCSSNSHADDAPPPLRSFVAAQRRLVKSGKAKGAAAADGGYFVETRAGAASTTALTPDVTSSDDLSSEEAEVARTDGVVVFGALGCCGGDAEDTAEGSGSPIGGSCRSSDVISVGSVELSKRCGRKAAADHGETLSVVDHKETFSAADPQETLPAADHEGGDLSGGCESEELLDAEHGGQKSIPNEGGVVGGDAFTKPMPPNSLTAAETGPEAPEKFSWISSLRWSWNGSVPNFFFKPREEEAAPSSEEKSE